MATAHELYKEAEQLKDEGKFDEAIAKLNETLEADENFVLAHLALGVVYGKVDKHEEAVKHAQRACELDPEDAFNFTALSVTLQRAFVGTQNQQFIPLAEEAMERSRLLQMRQR